jgi:ATP-binding cassette subfamily B protein
VEDSVSDDLLPELEDRGWFARGREHLATGFWSMAARLPRLVRDALAMAWSASRRDTGIALGANLAVGLLTALGLLATRDVVSALLATGPTADRVQAAIPALAWVAAATATRSGLSIASGWAQSRLTPQVEALVRARLLTATTSVDLVAFDDAGFADEMERARYRGTDAAAEIVSEAINLVTGLAGVTATAVTLLIIHPLLLPIAIVACLPVGWAAIRAAREEYASLYQRVALRRRMWMLEQLAANRYTATEVRANTMAAWLLERYRRISGIEISAALAVARSQSLTRLVGSMMAGVATAGVYLTLGWLIVSDAIPLAAAATAVFALQATIGALRLLILAVNRLYENGLYFNDLVRFHERAEERTTRSADGVPERFTEIALDRVVFSYADATSPAVDGISLTVRRGETIALVGENGSGKSSLAKILAGLYRPAAGRVLWDGVDVTSAEPHALHHHVAVIGQEWWKWPFTARQNVQIGRHTRDDGEQPVYTAAADANAHDMISDLPSGYDTLLSREFIGGQDLSGGQWQRLVAARAFYRDANLLICDEPSASLDAKAEDALFQRLRALAEDRAVVLITHRLANVRHADRIYVMHDGKITEQGTHAELMAAEGAYHEAFLLQRKGYADLPQQRTAAS